MSVPTSEAIERAALEALHAVATPAIRSGLGLESRAIGAAFVSVAAQLPPSAIVINRAIGLGLGQAATEPEVAEIVATYRNANVGRYFCQVHPQSKPTSIAAWCKAQGLERARGWQKFVRGRDRLGHSSSSLLVRQVGHDHAAAFSVIACDAFDLGDACRPWIERFANSDRWHLFMSFDGDEPAGTGAVFIDGDAAWTDFGATAPAFRKRGSQLALLQKRIEFALDNGCREISTCTGEDVPGDPQHSYTNILRCGFRETYVRENYAPPRP